MRRNLVAIAGFITALAMTASLAQATVITQMLGTANYTNGETVGTGTFASNPSGDPAPFDRLIGDKTNGPTPSTSFTFASYGGPIASPIRSATIEFGLYDGASPSPSTEVQVLCLVAIPEILRHLGKNTLPFAPADSFGTDLGRNHHNDVDDLCYRSVETYYMRDLPGTDFVPAEHCIYPGCPVQ